MKKTIPFITFLFLSLTLFSQDYRLYIYLEDNAGRRDTAIVGYNESSTMDIDPSFGEENIYGTPFDSLDVRIIKRDSLNYNCLRERHYPIPPTPNVYSPNNVDTKIDIRPFSGGTYYDSFETFINGYDYPISVTIQEEALSTPLYIVGRVYLLDADCNRFNFWEVKDIQMFTIDNNSFNTLVFEHEYVVNTNEIKDLKSSWTIFPNPASDRLEIESTFSLDGQFELINSNGQIIKSFDAVSDTKKISINLEEINKGIYIIRYINKNQDQSFVKKFVKL